MAVGVRILGSPVVRVDGEDRPVPGGRVGALLAVLALRPGRLVPTAGLCDAIWGDDLPANATNALQALVSRLRRVVGPAALVGEGGGYRLDVASDDVDAIRFADLVERGAAAGRAGDTDRAARLLTAALELSSGPLLGGTEAAGVLAGESVRLDELRAVAEEELLEAELAAGHHEAVVADAERLVGERPLRERRWGQLMLALYRSGRQADALRAFQRLRTTLVEELGIDPSPPLAQLERAILGQDPELTPVPSAPTEPEQRRTNIQAPDVVGRHDEAKALAATIASHRATVVVGPGGVGKTTLAAAAVALLPDDVAADGAFLADLAGVRFLHEARAAVASALGGGDRDSADDRLARLAGQDVLVVLDACEHLGATAGELAAELLDLAPRGRVLLTSRSRIPVPLAGDAAGFVAVEPLPPTDSVTLLRRRAAAAGVDSLPASDDELLALAEALDHLPLALELAAARTPFLSIPEIRRRLDDRLALLAAPRAAVDRDVDARHRSLVAVLDESHDLLGADAAALYRRLSVVPGSFTASIAEAVAPASMTSTAVLDALVELTDQSLLVLRASPDGPRYRLLDSVRAHAADRLDAAGDRAEAEAALVRWAVSWAATLGFDSPAEVEALRAARAEASVAQAALELAGPADRAAVVLRMWQWWDLAGAIDDGLRWTSTVLGEDGVDALDGDRSRGWAHFALGRYLDRRGDRDAAARETQVALTLARSAGDPSLAARSLGTLAYIAIADGRIDEARAFVEEATSAGDRSGDANAALAAANVAAYLAYATGRRHEAVARWEAGADLAGRSGLLGRRCTLLSNLGVAYDSVGEPARALEAMEEAIDLARVAGDTIQAAQTKANMLTVLRSLERDADAAGLASEVTEELLALGDERTAVRSLSHTVELALQRGDRPAAHLAAIRVTEIARRRDWPLEQHLGLRAQARVAMAYENVEQAIPLYRASVAHIPAGSYDDGRAITLAELGQAQLAAGRPADAVESLERARALLVTIDEESVDDIDELLTTARTAVSEGRS